MWRMPARARKHESLPFVAAAHTLKLAANPRIPAHRINIDIDLGSRDPDD